MQKDNLTARIRLARRIAGQSQAEMAECIGVGRSAIANWECGRAHPSTMHLAQLARATGISFEWLATGKGTMRTSEELQQPAPTLNHEEDTLLHAFRTASRKRQQQILYIALSLSTTAASALADLLAINGG